MVLARLVEDGDLPTHVLGPGRVDISRVDDRRIAPTSGGVRPKSPNETPEQYKEYMKREKAKNAEDWDDAAWDERNANVQTGIALGAATLPLTLNAAPVIGTTVVVPGIGALADVFGANRINPMTGKKRPASEHPQFFDSDPPKPWENQ